MSIFLVSTSISIISNYNSIKLKVEGGGGSGREYVVLPSGGGLGLDYGGCENSKKLIT